MDVVVDWKGFSQVRRRGAVLKALMEEVIGEEIPMKCRKARFVWARTMIAFELTNEGYTLEQVGTALDRDHSTIVHLRDKMASALSLPEVYKCEIDIWNKFRKKITDDIQQRTI